MSNLVQAHVDSKTARNRAAGLLRKGAEQIEQRKVQDK